ncbi:BEM_HP_G0013220.mRNA.1.CDS.1 [Saccharomyces cerevisiae]|nr:BEM_HP_G0013220.mRNA.1.CDS.1 [Saccharomyces cerevisiae]CAI6910013.1 BEM_HP_G0013220.mRNA.1.CDS.1 [Saccharomyces cerevisiae]
MRWWALGFTYKQLLRHLIRLFFTSVSRWGKFIRFTYTEETHLKRIKSVTNFGIVSQRRK